MKCLFVICIVCSIAISSYAVLASDAVYDLADYPDMFIEDGHFDGHAVVGRSAPSQDTIALTNVVLGVQEKCFTETLHCDEPAPNSTGSGCIIIKQLNPIPSSVFQFADEANMDSNIISLGNPCNNEITRQIVGSSLCDYGLSGDKVGAVFLRQYNGYVHMAVYGITDRHTVVLSRALQNSSLVMNGNEYFMLDTGSGTDRPTKPIDLSNYPDIYVSNGHFNALAVVGRSAPSYDTVAMTNILLGVEDKCVTKTTVCDATGQQCQTRETRNPIPSSALKFDDETSLNTNVIAVGNPCNNRITAQIVGSTKCDYGLSGNKVAAIFIREYNGYAHMAAYGITDQHTVMLARALQNSSLVMNGNEHFMLDSGSGTDRPTKAIDLSNYPDIYVSNGHFNALAVVGRSAPSYDTVAMTNILLGVQDKCVTRTTVCDARGEQCQIRETWNPMPQHVNKFDDEINLNSNIISIGNPCNNKITAQIVGSTKCDYGLSGNKVAAIFIREYNGYAHMAAYGITDQHTVMLARALQNSSLVMNGLEHYMLDGRQPAEPPSVPGPVELPDRDELPEGVELPQQEESPDLDECKANADCMDRNPCITGSCEGNPRVCSYQSNAGCAHQQTCVPVGMRIGVRYCALDSQFELQKARAEACSNNFECISNLCIDDRCVEPGLFQKFMDWLRRFWR